MILYFLTFKQSIHLIKKLIPRRPFPTVLLKASYDKLANSRRDTDRGVKDQASIINSCDKRSNRIGLEGTVTIKHLVKNYTH
jgi:hypothetical protein